MATFKISTNINRDADENLDYIVTRNANEVYNRIIHNYGKGQKSFSIIGSYGTGKSSFLWAFEHHLKGRPKFEYPINGEFKGVQDFVFARIIGEPASFKATICAQFDLNYNENASNKEIIGAFKQYCDTLERGKKALVLLIDEFGKHLEFIAKNNPDELYFIQELAEFCNDPERKILLITTLHQNFSVYSKGLSTAQRNEWDKVRGRLVGIAFDEPVEQLLFFAAQRLRKITPPESDKPSFKQGWDALEKSNLLGKSMGKGSNLAEDLYPVDPLSAEILTKALQRYGQNERSLFTFLESPELEEKINNQEPFTVSDCFDYLTQNLSSEIEDGEKNPFKPQWKASILALEKAEFKFEEEYKDVSRLIKTIGLVNIFSSPTGTLDLEVLKAYGQSFLRIVNPERLVKALDQFGIIRFSRHRMKYNFIDGTDVDIEQELLNATQHVDQEFNLISRLESYFDFGVIPAKRVQFEKGTPRFFQFKFWDEINCSEPEGEIDGYINLVFTKKRVLSTLKEYVKGVSPAQIFVLFKEVDEIRETLFEIDKIKFVMNKFEGDKVALHLLNEELLYRTKSLKRFVQDALFDARAKVTWVWHPGLDDATSGDTSRKVNSLRTLNKLLSDAAEAAYPKAPTYRNEMVNKEHLSTPILTARKALIRQIISEGDKQNLDFEPSRFPPEKTIYLSLLKETGIHQKGEGNWFFGQPKDQTFYALWNQTEAILKGSANNKLPLSEFFRVLKRGQFKLKQGFLDFWVHIFLVIKKEDYGLYYKNGEYIPHLTPDVADLMYKHPDRYFVKALANQGIRADYLGQYKELVTYNESNIKGLESSYITIYGNFLKFYRGLEPYTQKTKSGLSNSARKVRDAINKAKDPESALFKEIPEALGFFGLQENDPKLKYFLGDLKESIREIRGAYDVLIDRIEKDVKVYLAIDAASFDDFKDKLCKRFSAVNKSLIANPSLNIFYTRLVSPLDVKQAYWESVCDAVMNKKLSVITDEEVQVFIDRMKDKFTSLTDLIDIHQSEFEDKGEILRITILNQTGNKNLKRNLVISQEKADASKKLEAKLEKLMGPNAEINRIALLRLIEKEFEKHEKS